MSINAYSFFFRDLERPHLGFPFNIIRNNYNSDRKTQDYRIPWDFTTNKMRPGNYITESGIDYVVNTMGFRGWYPGRDLVAGLLVNVRVSPTRHSRTFFKPVAIYPTSPAANTEV